MDSKTACRHYDTTRDPHLLLIALDAAYEEEVALTESLHRQLREVVGGWAEGKPPPRPAGRPSLWEDWYGEMIEEYVNGEGMKLAQAVRRLHEELQDLFEGDWMAREDAPRPDTLRKNYQKWRRSNLG